MTISVKTITPFGNRIFVKIISGGVRVLGPGEVTVSSLRLNSPWTWDNRRWSGTWLSAPASGYFSSNLLPNVTITLIYGSSHPFNGSLSKSAHLQKQGPERKSWLCTTVDGLIDLGTTFLFHEWPDEPEVKGKPNNFTDKTEERLKSKFDNLLYKRHNVCNNSPMYETDFG